MQQSADLYLPGRFLVGRRSEDVISWQGPKSRERHCILGKHSASWLAAVVITPVDHTAARTPSSFVLSLLLRPPQRCPCGPRSARTAVLFIEWSRDPAPKRTTQFHLAGAALNPLTPVVSFVFGMLHSTARPGNRYSMRSMPRALEQL